MKKEAKVGNDEKTLVQSVVESLREKPYSVKKVDGFDPYDHLTLSRNELTGAVIFDSVGNPVLTIRVRAQQTWFETYAESKGNIPAIHVKSVKSEAGFFAFYARVYLDYKDAQLATEENPDAGALGTGYSCIDDIPSDKYDPYVTAQTRAIGNALTNAGFGSEIMMTLREKEMSGDENVIFDDKPTQIDTIPECIKEPEVSNGGKKKEQSSQKADKKMTHEEETVSERTAEPAQLSEEKADVGEKKQEEASEEAVPKTEKPSTTVEAVTSDGTESTGDEEADKEETAAFLEQLVAAGIKVPKDAIEIVETEAANETQEEINDEKSADEPKILDGSYVITEEDASVVTILETKIGATVESLGSDIVSSILEQMAEDLPDNLRSAMENFICSKQ